MRIIILLPKLHAGAELALNKILAHRDLDVVGIVRSDISIFTKKYWDYIKFGISRAGFFYAMMVGLMAHIHLIAIFIVKLLFFRENRKWLQIDELATKYRIPIHDTQNINSEESLKILKDWEPDVMVSVYFDQILKQPAIDISKQATLNIHPSIRYRGVMAEFWNLLNNDKTAGVTVHHIIEKIDAGNIIAQDQFPIKKNDSKFSLGIKLAQRGANLLISTLKKLKEGIKIKTTPWDSKSQYYSLPKKKDFEKFHARGKHLFSFKWLWKFFKRAA